MFVCVITSLLCLMQCFISFPAYIMAFNLATVEGSQLTLHVFFYILAEQC